MSTSINGSGGGDAGQQCEVVPSEDRAVRIGRLVAYLEPPTATARSFDCMPCGFRKVRNDEVDDKGRRIWC